MPPLLAPSEIEARLAEVPAWRLQNRRISRLFTFRDFSAALAFVNWVGALAEEAGHHPDITLRWNRVALELSTHSAGGLTERDFDLARRLDRMENLVQPPP